MSENRHFLIVDPFFFIYPANVDLPLNVKLVSKYILHLSEWAKLFKNPNYDIGISQECMELIKQHPRSILNNHFVTELMSFMAQHQQQISQVIIPMLSSLRSQTAFAEALGSVNPEQLIYELEAVNISPSQFCTRLPENTQEWFQKMMGDLTFVRAQKIFPVAIFDNISFVTHSLDTDIWIEELLTTIVQVTYIIDTPDVIHGNAESIPNLIDDSFSVLQSAESLLNKSSETRYRFTLKQVVERVTSKYPSEILISQELDNILKKTDDVLTNANMIEKAIEALRYWLKIYKERRSSYGEAQAITHANQAYQNLISHEISDASETVKQTPQLKNQRLAHFNGEKYYAFLHIKTTPRIYFTAIEHNDTFVVLLGHIDKHLNTARY